MPRKALMPPETYDASTPEQAAILGAVAAETVNKMGRSLGAVSLEPDLLFPFAPDPKDENDVLNVQDIARRLLEMAGSDPKLASKAAIRRFIAWTIEYFGNNDDQS